MLLSLALDARRADLATRERFHLDAGRLAALYREPRDADVRELLMVSTCNRIELYGWADASEPAGVAAALTDLARRWMGDDPRGDELLATATHRLGDDAAEHLLRVAAGLESPVIGDAQILGQVKEAYHGAVAAAALGPALHRLLATALQGGKRVAHEAPFVGTRQSVGAVAARHGLRAVGTTGRVVVVGCGITGRQAAREASRLGARDLVCINRTPGRALELGATLGARVAPWEQLADAVAAADLVIVATGSPVPILAAADLAARRDAARPLLVLDLAMPRNVTSDVGRLPGVTLRDLDAVQGSGDEPPAGGTEAVRVAEGIVAAQLARWRAWESGAVARAALRPLQRHLADVCRRELTWALGDAVAAPLVERIVAKTMAAPMIALRGALARGESLDDAVRLCERLFRPDEARRTPVVV